jgi:hypothetical protein
VKYKIDRARKGFCLFFFQIRIKLVNDWHWNQTWFKAKYIYNNIIVYGFVSFDVTQWNTHVLNSNQ